MERWIRLDKLAQVRGETSKMPTFRGVGDAAGIIKEYLGHHGAFVEESGGHERRTSGTISRIHGGALILVSEEHVSLNRLISFEIACRR